MNRADPRGEPEDASSSPGASSDAPHEGDLRQAERDLRESEQRFRVLFEQVAVGMALIDSASGRFVRINRRCAEILGYSEGDLTALDFVHLRPPEERGDDHLQIERLASGELREVSLETRLIRADGTPIWVALSASPLWDPAEAPSCYVAVIHDISARRAAEERGRHARDALESTLAALPDLLFDIDDEGRVYDFRAPDPEQLAASPEVFLGRTLAEVLPPAAVAVIHAAIGDALVTGRSSGRSYTLALRGGDKSFEISMARKSSITGSAGRPRFIAIARDISDRVEAEAQRRSLEAQLRQAQKMEAVGTLAGGIAHDFNNLLTVIGLSVESARAEVADDHPAVEPLEAIALVSRRAENLVRQILAFGRKQPASRVVLSANEAVLEATTLLRATFPAGIRLIVVTDPTEPRVHADPTQLQQVLINLGTNAWQAIERNTGTITFNVASGAIEAGQTSLAAGTYVRFRVSDDGVGMAQATLERVFEPFFTTKGPGKGSGLGLSVVHGIVQEHRGAIVVASQPRFGATFDVYLETVPATAALQPAASPSPAARAPTRATAALAAGRIVYVDDEASIVTLVLRLLEQLGYAATGFANPSDALAAIRADPGSVDLVMTDLSMPELSGLDLARELHAVRADLPIVLVSGFDPHPDDQLSELGIRHRLGKPFDAVALSSALRALLG